MKYLIIGLGNPGIEYENTRHNVGFRIVDKLAEEFDAHWKEERHGLRAEVKYKGRQLILFKPMTYMNLSGKAVRYWLQKDNMDLERMMVVLDDLNLPFGTIRLRAKGNAGGHNGLKDIDAHLGRQDYPRLRIGIGNDFKQGQQVDFVLGTWTDDEEMNLPLITKASIDAIKSFSTIGLERTISTTNKKHKLE